jgi:hypothetical protein
MDDMTSFSILAASGETMSSSEAVTLTSTSDSDHAAGRYVEKGRRPTPRSASSDGRGVFSTRFVAVIVAACRKKLM